MLRRINEIAVQTPEIDHWLPTRELAILRAFLAEGGTFADNLTVRVSAPVIGVTPRRQPFGLPIATVGCNESTTSHQCVALAQQGNRCLSCDMCWGGNNINYPLH
jgi:hypothetical protein